MAGEKRKQKIDRKWSRQQRIIKNRGKILPDEIFRHEMCAKNRQIYWIAISAIDLRKRSIQFTDRMKSSINLRIQRLKIGHFRTICDAI